MCANRLTLTLATDQFNLQVLKLTKFVVIFESTTRNDFLLSVFIRSTNPSSLFSYNIGNKSNASQQKAHLITEASETKPKSCVSLKFSAAAVTQQVLYHHLVTESKIYTS